MIQMKGSFYLKTLAALVVTTIFNNTAIAYEFDKVTPESVGYSSAKLNGVGII